MPYLGELMGFEKPLDDFELVIRDFRVGKPLR